jgi:OOP family OmpA-OmpF porin
MRSKAIISMVVFGMLLAGFVATPAPAAEVITVPVEITFQGVKIEAVKTADNFIVLFNTAETMNRPYKNTGMNMIGAAKEILKQGNKNLPDLSYNAGLYTFTPKMGMYVKSPLKAYYPMGPYKKEAFAKAIDELPNKGSGPTPIQDALTNLEPILKGLSGKTVVFLFSDGEATEMGLNRKTPQEIARELSQKNDVCFDVISSATGYYAQQQLAAVASINECSRVIPFSAVLGKPEYNGGALFVMDEKVFNVIATQEKVVGYKMDNVLFAFNSAEIKPEYYGQLDGLGEFMKEHPQSYVILAGFTDPVGSSEYNLQLSRRRVESVGNYLMTKFNIDQDRIVMEWYGDLAPVADNSTDEGRSQNRRVAGVVAGL